MGSSTSVKSNFLRGVRQGYGVAIPDDRKRLRATLARLAERQRAAGHDVGSRLVFILVRDLVGEDPRVRILLAQGGRQSGSLDRDEVRRYLGVCYTRKYDGDRGPCTRQVGRLEACRVATGAHQDQSHSGLSLIFKFLPCGKFFPDWSLCDERKLFPPSIACWL